MAYKSEAQREKFKKLLAQGKIKKSVVEEFDEASKGLKLPTRLKAKAAKPRKTKNKSKGFR